MTKRPPPFFLRDEHVPILSDSGNRVSASIERMLAPGGVSWRHLRTTQHIFFPIEYHSSYYAAAEME